MAEDDEKATPAPNGKAPDKGNAGRVAIFVAVIGLIGVLGAALIEGWPFSDPEPAPPPVSDDSRVIVAVERTVSKWLNALLKGDLDTFTSLSAENFYTTDEILLTKADIRRYYTEVFEDNHEDGEDITITQIKVQTASQLKERGYDLSDDTVLGGLTLGTDDYPVFLKFEAELWNESGIAIVRRTGEDYKVIGVSEWEAE